MDEPGNLRHGPKLVSHLDLWRIFLESGEVVEVAAHAASEREGWISFFVLVEGNPNREVAVASFPTGAVADWEGGFAFDGNLPTEESSSQAWPQKR
jgi:hypothetical protein